MLTKAEKAGGDTGDAIIHRLNTDFTPKLREFETKLVSFGYKPAKVTSVSARFPEGKRDDQLALIAAKSIFDAGFPELVVGNHLNDSNTVAHYAASAGNPPGFSLGDWGRSRLRLAAGPGADQAHQYSPSKSMAIGSVVRSIQMVSSSSKRKLKPRSSQWIHKSAKLLMQ